VHAWNAVFVCGAWRHLDCTWGAGHPPEADVLRPKSSASRQQLAAVKKQINEHFFLPDPQELIYSHFPYDEVKRRTTFYLTPIVINEI
jgi:transglutaminase/protease-like cytokinesis protein 3